MRPTTIEDMLKHTVQLNGLLIPIKSLEQTLALYTHPLVVWNHNETYSCSLIGSCIGIHYRERYLLLCTRHQLKTLEGRSYEDVGLLDKDGKSFCSAGGIRYYNNDINDEVLNDLAVFDFTEPCKDRTQMKERFFNLNGLPPDVPSNQVVGLVVSGYPTDKQDYGMNEETRHLGFAQASITCSIASDENQLEDSTVLKLNVLGSLSLNPDGMSGGAAFTLQLVNGTAHAHLAGMVVMAGSNNFYILKIGCILNSINSWLKT
ncbi:MAG: hypothetical protein J0M34_05840 [Alphaproteobacteria bacterium]|nr:hypothetical protein [Alphaproteobacteria bacterium]